MSDEVRKVLPEGQYVLSQDVTNPSADRRHKRSVEFMVTWTAGMKFDVRVNTFNYEHAKIDYNTIKGTGWFGQLSSTHDGFDAVVAALVPVDRSTGSLGHRMTKNYVSNETVLETLTEVFGWDMNQLEDFVATLIAREDEKES
jgi:hypothetical protein